MRFLARLSTVLLLLLLSISSQASFRKVDGIMLSKPVLLSDEQARNLDAEIVRQHLSSDEVTITFRCIRLVHGKGKRPSKLGCVAYSLKPSGTVSTPK